MKKSVLIILIACSLIIIFTAQRYVVGTKYILEEVSTEEWLLKGGTVDLVRLNRELNIGELIYTGTGDREVQKVTMELKTKSFLGIFPDEILSTSTIGGDKSWKIEKGFSFGRVRSNTHSISVLKSYFVKAIELHIQVESSKGLDGVVIEVPVH